MRNAPNQTQAAKIFGPGRVALRRGFVDVFGCGRRRFARRRRAQFLFALAFFFLLLLLGEVALAFCECVVGFGQWTVFLSWIGVAKNDSMTLRVNICSSACSDDCT